MSVPFFCAKLVRQLVWDLYLLVNACIAVSYVGKSIAGNIKRCYLCTRNMTKRENVFERVACENKTEGSELKESHEIMLASVSMLPTSLNSNFYA